MQTAQHRILMTLVPAEADTMNPAGGRTLGDLLDEAPGSIM
jgi:hypothetical protein